MIHEIAPDKYNPEYRNITVREQDYVIAFNKTGILLKYENESFSYLTFGEYASLANREYDSLKNDAYYLFEISNEHYFLVDIKGTEIQGFKEFDDIHRGNKNTHYLTLGMQAFRELAPMKFIFAGVNAYHIYNWKKTKNYCGVCGGKLRRSSTERAFVCTECNMREYPKISPAIIVAIRNEGKILLVRNKLGNYKKPSLIAGYVEIGETFEDAVYREVMEEVGLKIKNLTYYDNQPWGLTGAQMIGFYADLDGSDKITLQESELSEAKWYSRDEIPMDLSNRSIGNKLIIKFKKGEI